MNASSGSSCCRLSTAPSSLAYCTSHSARNSLMAPLRSDGASASPPSSHHRCSCRCASDSKAPVILPLAVTESNLACSPLLCRGSLDGRFSSKGGIGKAGVLLDLLARLSSGGDADAGGAPGAAASLGGGGAADCGGCGAAPAA